VCRDFVNISLNNHRLARLYPAYTVPISLSFTDHRRQSHTEMSCVGVERVRNYVYCIQHLYTVDIAVVINRNRLFSTVGVTTPEIGFTWNTAIPIRGFICGHNRRATICHNNNTWHIHVMWCTAQLGLLIL
jgi:hypothetical protein